MPSSKSRKGQSSTCPGLRYADTTYKDLLNGRYNVNFVKKIGSGHTGTVSKCTINMAGKVRDIAVKVVVKGKTSRCVASQEIEMLRRCQDKHVVQFEDALECRDGFLIVTECCNRGDLFSNLKQLDDAAIRECMAGIVQGVLSLHAKLVAHCDLKMKNILIADNNVVKLADFGFAVQLNTPCDTIDFLNGTDDYWGPETRTTPTCFNPLIADIYALGVTFVGMLERRAIKRKTDNVQQIARDYKDLQLRQLLIRMLDYYPQGRWTIVDVKNSDWLNDMTPPPSPT